MVGSKYYHPINDNLLLNFGLSVGFSNDTNEIIEVANFRQLLANNSPTSQRTLNQINLRRKNNLIGDFGIGVLFRKENVSFGIKYGYFYSKNNVFKINGENTGRSVNFSGSYLEASIGFVL